MAAAWEVVAGALFLGTAAIMWWHEWRSLSDKVAKETSDDSALLWFVMAPLVVVSGGLFVAVLDARIPRLAGLIGEAGAAGLVLEAHLNAERIGNWLRRQADRIDTWPSRRRDKRVREPQGSPESTRGREDP